MVRCLRADFRRGRVGLHGTDEALARRGAEDWRLPVLSLLNFAIIGVLAMHFPQLLGNGKGPAGLAFDGGLTISLAAMLLVLKVVITASSLRAGARGRAVDAGPCERRAAGDRARRNVERVLAGGVVGRFAVVGATAFLALRCRCRSRRWCSCLNLRAWGRTF